MPIFSRHVFGSGLWVWFIRFSFHDPRNIGGKLTSTGTAVGIWSLHEGSRRRMRPASAHAQSSGLEIGAALQYSRSTPRIARDDRLRPPTAGVEQEPAAEIPGASRVDDRVAAGGGNDGVDQVDAQDPLGNAPKLGDTQEEGTNPIQNDTLAPASRWQHPAIVASPGRDVKPDSSGARISLSNHGFSCKITRREGRECRQPGTDGRSLLGTNQAGWRRACLR